MSDRRVALITGSGRGIGRATAVALAHDYDIVVHYRRDEAAARQIAAELEKRGTATLVARAELESADDLDDLVDSALARFGRVDAFVANAAAGAFKGLLESNRKHAERTMDTIVTSFVHLTGRLAPLMDPGGRIVAVSGPDAVIPVDGGMQACGGPWAGLDRFLRSSRAP